MAVFRFANKEHADRISAQDFFSALKKLVPSIFETISEEEITMVVPNPLTHKVVEMMMDSN